MTTDRPQGFESSGFLFTCDNRNRGILRMNFDEAALLWKAAQATSGALLEVGRRLGGSTMLLAMATAPRPITSIDIAPEHHHTIEAMFANPSIAERLELIVGDSREPLPNRRFGFAFIDGDHSFDGVLNDVLAHWPALQGHGTVLVAFHDAVPNAGLRTGPDGAAEVARAVAQHADEPELTNHYVGVEAVCEELVASGAARAWGKAGSLLVMQKLSELATGFAGGAASRLRSWHQDSVRQSVPIVR